MSILSLLAGHGHKKQPAARPVDAPPGLSLEPLPSCHDLLVGVAHARNRTRIAKQMPNPQKGLLRKAEVQQRMLEMQYEACGGPSALPASARTFANSRQSILLLTSCNKAYTAWLDHFLRNLALFGLEQRLGVCAEDEETVAFARSRGLSSAFVAGTARKGGGALDYGTSAYFDLLHRRQLCFWNFLQARPANTMVLLVDTDFTFFQDPLKALPPRALSADVAILDDSGPNRPHNYTNRGVRYDTYLNAGFMLLRNTPATQELGRRFLLALKQQSKENDQAVLNDVMWPVVRMGWLDVTVLDPEAYSNGFRFFEGRGRPTCGKPIWCVPLNAGRLVAVHHNWCRGDVPKWKRATTYQLITKPNESAASFLHRARLSVRQMPGWDYKTGNPVGQKALPSKSKTATKSTGRRAQLEKKAQHRRGTSTGTCMLRIVGDCPDAELYRSWWPATPPVANRAECELRQKQMQSKCDSWGEQHPDRPSGTVELLPLPENDQDPLVDSMEI